MFRGSRLVLSALLILGVVITVDQGSKYLVNRSPGTTVGPFQVEIVLNSGFAFSLPAPGPAAEWLSVVWLVTMSALLPFLPSRWMHYAALIIIGAGLSNAGDRVRYGGIRDILTYHTASFNLADLLVATGALLLMVLLIRDYCRSLQASA